MFSPDVWTFLPPHVNKQENKGNIFEKDSFVHSLIEPHYYNHSASIILPDTLTVPESLKESLIDDCEYYCIKRVPIHELIKKPFIEAFVNKGELTLLSGNTRIDQEPCLALTPSGHLILKIDTQNYQELGIEGKPSHFCSKYPFSYFITLNLKAPCFIPGKKNYERTFKQFSSKSDYLVFDILVSWNHSDSSICPSSIAKYFHTLGYQVEEYKPKFISCLKNQIAVPLLDDDTDTNEFIEWLGMFSLQANIEFENHSEYLTSYQLPENTKTSSSVVHYQWLGFFPNHKIMNLLNELKNFLRQRPDIPWASLFVQGYADSPISWHLKEHNYFTDGDNDYTLILKPNGDFLSQSILSSSRRPRKLKSALYGKKKRRRFC